MRQEPLQCYVRDLITSNTLLVSIGLDERGGNGNSVGPMLSSNGQFVVFASDATNLVAGDTNDASDIFVRDLNSGITRLVSADLSGNPPRDDKTNSAAPLSANPLISADGRWVFFESRVPGLTAVDDTNGTIDVFARDLVTNLTFTVSLDATGTRTASGTSTLACLSADARYVGFISTATDVAPGGTNAAGDFYRRDMVSGERLCASRNVGSLLPESYRCVSATLSADGRYVAFATEGTSNAVFRHDFDSDSTTLLGLRTPGNGAPRISANGRFVVFEDGTNVFRFDANAGTNELVNLTITGAAPSSGIARNPVATADGNGIVFISNSSDLVTNSSSLFQIYARDMAAGKTRLITMATNGQPARTNSEVSLLAVTPDFLAVAFDSTAADLVAADGNRGSDVFVHDLATETSALVSVRSGIQPRESGVAHAFIGRDCVSADGRFITVMSYDSDLVGDDVNLRPDVFIRDMETGTVMTTGISTNAARFPAISGNGRYVAYLRRNSIFIGGAVWRFDRETGTNELVASSSQREPVISSNGNLVAFIAGNELIVRDMAVATDYPVAPATPTANHELLFTPDGRFLLFQSPATSPGLYAWDTVLRQNQLVRLEGGKGLAVSGNSRFIVFNASTDLVLHDLIAKTNQLVRSGLNAFPAMNSLNEDGTLIMFADSPNRLLAWNRMTGEESIVADGADVLKAPAVSGDGRFVIYMRRLLTAVGGQPVFTSQLYVRDRTLGTTILIAAAPDGNYPNGAVAKAVLAADGRTVVFHSLASDLVPGDFNDKNDVFVLKLGGTDSDHDGMDDDWEVAYFGNLARNGTADFDGDGANDLNEFLAGTDPTNNGSIFRVLTVTPMGGGNTRLLWTGNPNRNYRVEFKDTMEAETWSSLNGTISWNGGTASIIDAGSDNSTRRFYRVVRLP
jgi:Tol biopolymer transport system component